MKISGRPPQDPGPPPAKPKASDGAKSAPKRQHRPIDSFTRTAEPSATQVLFRPAPAQRAEDARLTRLEQSVGLTDPATFGPHPIPPGTEPRAGGEATAAEAAAWMQQIVYTHSSNQQAWAFGEFLKNHQGDAKWLQDFFGYLGADKTAELISQAVSFDSSAYPPTRLVELETVQQALIVLHETNALNARDMDALVVAWGPRFNPELALMFGGLPAGKEELQNLFVFSAVSYGASAPPPQGAESVAAAGAHVLAQTSGDNQLLVMRQVQQAGQLASFVDNAARGPNVVMTVDSFGSVQQASFDGIARLIYNLAGAHVRDGHLGPLPISPQELSQLRFDVFREAVKVLGSEPATVWADNALFKSGLTAILMQDFDRITRSILPPKNQLPSPDDPFFRGMRGLLESTLFAVPLSAESQRLAALLGEKLSAISTALQSGISEEELLAQYGLGRVDLTRYEGMLLGLVTGGLALATERIKDDAHAMRQVLDVLGTALQVGASTLWAGNPFLVRVILTYVGGKARGAAADVFEEWLAKQGMDTLELAPDLTEWLEQGQRGVEVSELLEGFYGGLGLDLAAIMNALASGRSVMDRDQ